MDPTKSFDHLDPKLKETYARVMGTATGGTGDASQTQLPTNQQAPVPSFSAPPDLSQSTGGISQPSDDLSQFSSAPLESTSTTNQMPQNPTPGVEPINNALPTDTTTAVSPIAETEQPSASINTPANASFFSNPSPTTTEPPQMPTNVNAPIEPPTIEPVTPYAPSEFGANQNIAVDQANQSLPSPSEINQATPHEASSLLRVLYIIGAVIFFAIYTFFWIKVFNLPIPFLSQ
ncbi:MAG TPA: hypothetical protein VNW29_01685 [Candidatus Sulfotelmatobacter sp.]|jgi:hypothetical protein|nr:hypothetical protein [Candidatus Sulfotelmatobacter sp.]